MEASEGFQPATTTSSIAVQTAVLVDAAVQCEALPAAASESAVLAELLQPQLARFLRSAAPLCEQALQQNELVDVLVDELDALAAEEGEGPRGGGASAASAGAGLSELAALSDLSHIKGRVLAALQWHPTRRGVVGVACAQQQQAQLLLQQEEQDVGTLLLWSAADATRPEAVLQAPAQVLAFAFHPSQPHWVAAGLATGQVALFNLQQPGDGSSGEPAGAADGRATAAAGGDGGSGITAAAKAPILQAATSPGGGAAKLGAAAAAAAALQPVFVSLPEASHQAAVTDLQWLPGLAVTREGKLVEGSGAPAGAPSEAAGISAAAAATTTTATALFATTASDGALLVWDMRISARHQRLKAAAAAAAATKGSDGSKGGSCDGKRWWCVCGGGRCQRSVGTFCDFSTQNTSHFPPPLLTRGGAAGVEARAAPGRRQQHEAAAAGHPDVLLPRRRCRSQQWRRRRRLRRLLPAGLPGGRGGGSGCPLAQPGAPGGNLPAAGRGEGGGGGGCFAQEVAPAVLRCAALRSARLVCTPLGLPLPPAGAAGRGGVGAPDGGRADGAQRAGRGAGPQPLLPRGCAGGCRQWVCAVALDCRRQRRK